eukprot:scaffold426_cov219-Amphora_coffeaeformis.AAC.42
MKFRPCIDLHQGHVKQIVGSTLRDEEPTPPAAAAAADQDTKKDALKTNFTADQPAEWFAELYQKDRLTGGHVIMLGPGNTEAAKAALAAYPNQLQVGGGITLDTAQEWINAGASHVIVTSFVFKDGQIHKERLQSLVNVIGKERLVLDLSCRRQPEHPDGDYYVVTDRWQKFTDYPVNPETLQDLSNYCAEFLVHGVDVEGLQCGILPDLVTLLGQACPIPVTYAGGVRSLEDLELVRKLGNDKVDCTVGSALDIFGGSLSYAKVVEWHKKQQP